MKNLMKKTFSFLENVVEKMLAQEIGWTVFFGSFLGMIFLRSLEEKFLASSGNTAEGAVIVFLYNFFFFAILYLLLWACLSFFLKISLKKMAGIIFWSFWLILLPPVFDMLKTGGSVFWSFYALNSPAELWGQFITLFGRLPSGIVYFGTKIVFISTILLAGGFIFLRTKSFLRTIIGAAMAYVIIFFMGSFPSWAAFVYYFFEGSKDVVEVTGVDIVQFFAFPYPIFGTEGYGIRYAFTYNLNMVYFMLLLFMSSAMFFAAYRKGAVSVMKNSRFPQLAYHGGLFFVGIGLGFLAYPENWHFNLFSIMAAGILLSSIFLAWMASVVVNDLYDIRIDMMTNSDRPLPRNVFSRSEYMDLGWILFGLSLLGGLVISIKFAFLLLAYQVLAWFYSASPYRLKRFPVVATFFSSLASVLVLIIGFNLFSGEENMSIFPWRVLGLLVVALTLSLPIKDFKDIEGDKNDGVRTIPVIFGESLGRTIVGTGIFVSFMLSVFVLNETKLFWPALISGGISFWAMTNKKIKPRQFNWWVLWVLALYVAIMAKVLFF